METKVCTRCSSEKSIEDFPKKNANKCGRAAQCKACQNKYLAEWREDKKLNYYIVYYLPKEHYIGITNQPELRMNDHKHHENRDITDWRVMYCTKDKYEARLVENRYHDLGFFGLSLT